MYEDKKIENWNNNYIAESIDTMHCRVSSYKQYWNYFTLKATITSQNVSSGAQIKIFFIL